VHIGIILFLSFLVFMLIFSVITGFYPYIFSYILCYYFYLYQYLIHVHVVILL
jgi:hypothetical protein